MGILPRGAIGAHVNGLVPFTVPLVTMIVSGLSQEHSPDGKPPASKETRIIAIEYSQNGHLGPACSLWPSV